MDPIEKLLSDLAPARASGDLDQTMARLFDRADRNARLVRSARSFAAMIVMLAIGLGVGYHFGANSDGPVSEPTITYLVPLENDASAVDSLPSVTPTIEPRPGARSGSIAITILKKDTA